MQDKGPAMYDDIYRIHLVARWPGGASGLRDDHFVSLVDLPATFVDAAGVDVPGNFDGRSLRTLLAGAAPPDWRDDIRCEFHGHHFPYPQRMLRTRRHKLVVNPPDVNELYDLEVDPFELVNQIENPIYAGVRRELMGRLYRQLRDAGDNFFHWMTTMFEVERPEHEDTSLSHFQAPSPP
jgi:arylsulfatase A-like enzyme